MTAVVVGHGAITGFGAGCPALWDGVFAGARAVRPRERLADAPGLEPALPAAEVPANALPGGAPEGRALAYARIAAREALAGVAPRSVGLVLATTKADMSGVVAPAGDGPPGLGSPARLARRLATALDLTGPVAAVSCACSSGLTAVGVAGRWLRRGAVERALVVGVDALTPFVLRGFASLLALDPAPCRPFDAERRGLSLGEGAGALLLARDGEGPRVAGWGESNDANHITGPCRDGSGLRLAAERALRSAGLAPADVDYVHLHGTGTRYNDASEALALRGVFGGPTPPASGTKAQTGHTLGAAGVLELLVVIEALRRGVAPGNVGLRESDVDPALSLTRAAAPLARARTALKVSAGFAGINAAVVVRR